ncbi:MAG TPA: hypothetical protein VFS39_17375 [Nitrospira sp.]|nr:hypothetical protein [Nitrospira sp.]
MTRQDWTRVLDPEAPVFWGVVIYQSGKAFHGTILSVSPQAWVIAGSCPVREHMSLKMRLWPGYKRSAYVEVEHARVLWVKPGSFGVTMARVREGDEAAIFMLEQKRFATGVSIGEDVRDS